MLYGVGHLPSKVRALEMESSTNRVVQAWLNLAEPLIEQSGVTHVVNLLSAARSALAVLTVKSPF